MKSLDPQMNYGQMVLDSIEELKGKSKIKLSYIQKQAKIGLGRVFNLQEVKELKRLYKEQNIILIQ